MINIGPPAPHTCCPDRKVVNNICEGCDKKYTDYKWFWKSKLPERKNQLCRVLARGKLNSILVEFDKDGYRVVTSRFAVRKTKTK